MFKIEDKGMDEFRDTLSYFEKNFPKEAKIVLRKAKNRAKTIVLRRAKQDVGKKSGNYYKAIKGGKVFKQDGDLTARVYISSKIAPHGHLIERGHRQVTKDGREVGFVEGKFVFDRTKNEVGSQYDKIIEQEFDKILDKL
ncbi:hypothetical protein SAMN05446037_100165 [Anaerovirgula multivorans]|uniref:Uncharacterized protein n=1 Tax=Anaerovirgula multivorans TaxID=312168 RepID=A0A238ZRE7_9FIRM|nr:HK97 gp10 family phage protein [Anaerovirgula multivorans]SNR86016.1 hypothetical protein SAMN05446037_100165 [Anaerovirgula multivorans]